MSIITPTSVGFKNWLESDFVDFNDINSNFKKIDSLVNCSESGTEQASCSPASDNGSNVTWYYKKFTDGTVEISARVSYSNMLCNDGSSSPYYSSSVKLKFPFVFKKIYSVQIHQSANAFGWVSDITGKTVTDYVEFRSVAINNEGTSSSNTIYKEFFIDVKGEV